MGHRADPRRAARARHRRQQPLDTPLPRAEAVPPPGQSWRTFLANHRPRIWAADLFTVQTLTFETLYVLVFITHGRRELVHWNVSAL